MIRHYAITVAGRERRVEVEDLGAGRLRIVSGGRERVIERRRAAAGELVWTEGVEVKRAFVSGTPPRLVVTVVGALVSVNVADARGAVVAGMTRERIGTGGTLSLRAPMPGRIVKILAGVGQKVGAGSGVVVIEAMKMENEIRAPRATVVRQLRCSEGQAVENGQELAILE